MDDLDIDTEALVATFLAEAEEIFTQMEQVLVELEANPSDAALLHTLFRDAHTLKGGAAIVGFGPVHALAHELEDTLERLRDRTLAVSDAVVTVLLQSVDALRAALAAAADGDAELPEAAVAFRARLAALAGREPAPPAEEHAPLPARPVEPHRPAPRSLRVNVEKLDRMLDLSGEIAIARGRLTDMLETRTQLTVEEILSAHREADRLYVDMQQLVMKARMVPIGPTFHKHVRTVRDIASGQGKQVRLVIRGQDVEVDTAVVEHIRDPLMHMVRNAIDHGIERPDVRQQRGKDRTGTLLLSAHHEAGSIVVQVQDDGGGLDRRRIAASARSLGLLSDPGKTSEAELQRLVFEPGVTTSETVTELSGRGVGMDVVRRNVESLRGSVAIASEPGLGTTVTLRLPLTLAIIQGFRVRAAGDTYILPLETVVECLELRAEERAQLDRFGSGVVHFRGQPLPTLRLSALFRLGGVPARRENVVVVRNGGEVAGLAVDALEGETQTVIKPLGRTFRDVPGISGSAILGDGRVALILDVPGLLREALRRTSTPEAWTGTPAPDDVAQPMTGRDS